RCGPRVDADTVNVSRRSPARQPPHGTGDRTRARGGGRMSGRAAIAPKALDVTEQAFHVVRRNVGALIPAYAIGSVPFVLALIYFYTDMAYSAFARDHVAILALVVAVLFVWMKVWHTFFAMRVRALVRGESFEALDWRRIVQIVHTQIVVQATGL